MKNTARIKISLIFMILIFALSACGKEETDKALADALGATKDSPIIVEFIDLPVKQEEKDKQEEKQEIATYDTPEYEQESVDLIFFMGQSNMAGYGGDKSLAPEVDETKGEEYRVISDPESLHKIEEPFGSHESNPNGLRDDTTKWKGSLVSSYINSYYDRTGHKVIAVSISCGGMAMDLWLNDPVLNDCKDRIAKSKRFLTDKGYNIEKTFIVWLQGESDALRLVDPEEYGRMFDEFMSQMLAEGVDEVDIITPGRTMSDPESYTAIINKQKEMCQLNDKYVLATDKLQTFDAALMSDEYHYGQQALNEIGAMAASGN